MENFYSVSELITIFKISKETFYKVKGKNKQFFEDNSRKVREDGKNGKPIFKYSQSVFDFFASQYGTEEAAALLENASARGTLLETETARGTSPSSFENASARGTSTEAPETPPEAPQATAREEAAAKEIDALKAEIDALKGQLEKAEGERAELIKQNGNLLLLLNQEKAEKQLLLPPSKKSIGERIKAIFRK